MSAIHIWLAGLNLLVFPTLAELLLRKSTSENSRGAAVMLSYVIRLILILCFLIAIDVFTFIGINHLDKRLLLLMVACIGSLVLSIMMFYFGKKLSQKLMLIYGVMQIVFTALTGAYVSF